MKLQIIEDFEVNKALKSLQFDAKCRHYHEQSHRGSDPYMLNSANPQDHNHSMNGLPSLERTSAPEQALVVKWLREEHDITITVAKESIGSDEYVYVFEISYLLPKFRDAKRRVILYTTKSSFTAYGGTYDGGWNSYDEAELAGIKSGIEALKEIISEEKLLS